MVKYGQSTILIVYDSNTVYNNNDLEYPNKLGSFYFESFRAIYTYTNGLTLYMQAKN